MSLAHDVPHGDPDGLRYYQRRAVDAVHEKLASDRSTLLVMATGLGKTQTFGAIAKHWPGRVLVIAHRDELVSQAAKRLAQMSGEQVGVEQASFFSRAERIVVGSVQTLHREKRLMRYQSHGSPTLVIADESQHAPSRTWKKILNHWPAAKVLGVTATPDRADKRSLGDIFASVAYRMDITEGIHSGYLVPIIGERVYVEKLDISSVKSNAGDLSAGELDEEMAKVVEPVCRTVAEKWGDRRGVVFLPGKRSAKMAFERMEAILPNSSALVTDETPAEERRELIAKCKSGETRYLFNCLVATEGFDWPHADLVVLARPTKSRALHTQMVGRGTRVLPGLVEHIDGEENAAHRRALIESSTKSHAIIADFVGNCGKHSLVSLEDCFAANAGYSGEEVERAKKIAKKKNGGDPMENLREAREQLRKMAKSYTAKVSTRVERFDPFASMGVNLKSVAYMDEWRGREPMTPGQRAALKNIGLDDAELSAMSKRAAQRFFQSLDDRKRKGLCTFKHMKALSKRGVDAKNMTFEQARLAMDFLASSGWKASPDAIMQYVTSKQGAMPWR